MKSNSFSKKLLSAFLAVLMAFSCFSGVMSAYAASADTDQTLYDENLKYNFLGWVDAADDQVLDALLDFVDDMLAENLGSAQDTLNIQVTSINYDLTSVNGILSTLESVRTNVLANTGLANLLGDDARAINLGGQLKNYISTGKKGDLMTRQNSSSKEIIRGLLNVFYMNSNSYAKNGNNEKGSWIFKAAEVADGGQVFQHVFNGTLSIGGLEGLIVSIVKGAANINPTENTLYGVIGGLLGAPKGFEKNIVNNVAVLMLKQMVADNYADQGMINTIDTSGTTYCFVDAQNNKMTLEQWAFDAINKCVLDTLIGLDEELIYKDSDFRFDVNANAYDTIYGAIVPLFEHTLLPLFSTISLDFNFVTHFTKMYYSYVNGVSALTGTAIDASSQAKLDAYWTEEQINNWITVDYVEIGKYIGAIQTPESTDENRIYQFPGMAVFDEEGEVIGLAEGVTAADVKDAMLELFNSLDRHAEKIDPTKLFACLLYSPVAEALGCETGVLNLNLKDYYLTKFNLNNYFDFTVFNGGSIKSDLYGLLTEMLSFLFPKFNNWAPASANQDVDGIVKEVVASAGNLIKYVGDSISPVIFAGVDTITEDNFETAILPFLRAIFGEIDLTKQIHEEEWNKCDSLEGMLYVALTEYLKFILPQYDYTCLGRVGSDGFYDVTIDDLLPMARDALAYVMQHAVPITTDGTDNEANRWDVFVNGGTANGKLKDTSFTAFDMLNSLVVYYANSTGIAQLLNITKYSIYGTADATGYDSAVTMGNTIWENLDMIVNKAFPILADFLGVEKVSTEAIIMDGLVNNILNMSEVNTTEYGHNKQGFSAMLYNLVYGFTESSPMTDSAVLTVVYRLVSDLFNVILGPRDSGDGFGVFLPANTGVQPISDLISNRILSGGNVNPSSACDYSKYSGEGIIGILFGRIAENSVSGPLYTKTKAGRDITDTVLPGLASVVKIVSDIVGFIPQLGESKFTSPDVKFSSDIMEGLYEGDDILDMYVGVKNIAQGLNGVIFNDGSSTPTQLPRYFIEVTGIECANDSNITVDKDSRYNRIPGKTITYTPDTKNAAATIAPGATAYYPIEGFASPLGAKEIVVSYVITDKEGNAIGDGREYTVSGQFYTTEDVSTPADEATGTPAHTVTFTPEKKAPSMELAAKIQAEVTDDRQGLDETNFDIFTYRLMVKAAQRAESLVYGTYEKVFETVSSNDAAFQSALTYDFYVNGTGDANEDTWVANTTLALFLGNVAEGKYADLGLTAEAVEGTDFYFGNWAPAPEYLDKDGNIIYDYVTDADEATVNEAIRVYNLYKNEIVHRGYENNDGALLREILCATGDAYSNNNLASLRSYVGGAYTATVDAAVEGSGVVTFANTSAAPKYGALENGVLVNKGDVVYTDESWNNYVDALAAAIVATQTAATSVGYKEAMYNSTLAYDHQVTDINAYRTAVMIAENELEEFVEEPSNGHSVTAYIGALADPSAEYGTYAVTGATVTVGDVSAVTDNDGKFTLEGLADGTYEATVTYKYGFTRTFTIVVDGADVVSDVMVGIVGCDLSGDTLITAADYSIYSKVVGATSTSADYEVGYDFNRDGMITAADYAVYSKFVGCTAAGMAYTDTVIK